MKHAILILIFCAGVRAATYYSCSDGTWSSASTWASTLGGSCGAGVPGNGDGVYISTGTHVHVDVDTTVGQSATGAAGPSNTAITVGTLVGGVRPASSSAVLEINTGVTLHVRGNVAILGCRTNSRTPGYFPVILNADSVFEFDSSATTPTSTTYAYLPDPSNNSLNFDWAPKATGAAGHPAVFRSNAAGGDGYFTEGSGAYNKFGAAFAYTDFIRIGDATNNAMTLDDYVLDLGFTDPFSCDHCRFTSTGLIYAFHGNSHTAMSITNSQCSGQLDPSLACFTAQLPAPAAGVARLFSGNSNIGQTGSFFPVGSNDLDVNGWMISKNMLANIQDFGHSGPWASFDSNLVTRYTTFTSTIVRAYGDFTNNYTFFDGNGANDHGWSPDYSLSAVALTGNIFETSALGSNYSDTGDMFSAGGAASATVTAAHNIHLCGGDAANNSPGDLFTLAANTGITWNVTNNTGCFTAPGSQSLGFFIVESGTNGVGSVPIFKGNIGYSPVSNNSSLWADSVCQQGSGSICVTDILTPSGALYDAAWNLTQSSSNPNITNNGNFYLGKFSTTPAAALNEDPQFVDDNRGFALWSSKHEGEVCPAWVTGQAYSVGDCASVSAADWYRGATVNLRCIVAHISDSSTQPGVVDSDFRSVWEFKSAQDIRDAMFNGTTYSGDDPITALVKWTSAGMAPRNPHYINSSAPNGYIGAVLPVGGGGVAPTVVLSYANGAQDLNGTYIVASSIGTPLTLDASGSTSGGDPIACAWSQTSGPAAAFSAPSSCTTTITTSAFGTAYVSVTVTSTATLLSAAKSIKVGGVPANAQDVVAVADSRISTILGPMIRLGANPWAWADNRAVAMAGLQITNIPLYFTDYWNVDSGHGTLTATPGSLTLTCTNGPGTCQLQTDFCGGPGNTAPVVNFIIPWYPSATYPGSTGRWFAPIASCDSQTQITLTAGHTYQWQGQNGPPTTGMHYAISDNNMNFNWTYGPIPGNYYDNVLAFYSLYYRSGIDDFLSMARTLASRWWTGPNMNRGDNYDRSVGGQTYSVAGPARGQSVTGLVLWSIDTGSNVWPGLHHVWDYWTSLLVTFNASQSWNMNVGNLREDAYMMAGLSLCSLYDADSTYKNGCTVSLDTVINDLWAPLEINNTWQTVNGDATFTDSSGTVYVTVTDGSPIITLSGATWSAATFAHPNPYDESIWFIRDPTNVLFGAVGGARQNSDISNDAVAYQVGNVIDSTHASLTTRYNSGHCPAGCRYGMEVSQIPGFGTQPYMQGLLAGVFATYTYQALAAAGGYSADLVLLKKFVQDSLTFLSTSFDPLLGMYGSMNYLGCPPGFANYPNGCGPAFAMNGEAMRAFSGGYALNPTPAK